MIDVLRSDLKILKRQRKEAFAAYHKTQGAIDYLEHLINQMEGLTEQEFAEMIAGKGTKVEEIKNVSK